MFKNLVDPADNEGLLQDGDLGCHGRGCYLEDMFVLTVFSHSGMI